MLFVTTYKPRGKVSEDEEKRILKLFSKWQISPQVKVVGWWVTMGSTGILVSEADNAEAILEGIAPWLHAYEFDVQPVVDVAKFAELGNKAIAWRESVS